MNCMSLTWLRNGSSVARQSACHCSLYVEVSVRLYSKRNVKGKLARHRMPLPGDSVVSQVRPRHSNLNDLCRFGMNDNNIRRRLVCQGSGCSSNGFDVFFEGFNLLRRWRLPVVLDGPVHVVSRRSQHQKPAADRSRLNLSHGEHGRASGDSMKPQPQAQLIIEQSIDILGIETSPGTENNNLAGENMFSEYPHLCDLFSGAVLC